MYIWTIPTTENNVLSLRATKGENGATTTMTMTTIAASREHIDFIVGLLIIRWGVKRQSKREYVRENL